MSKRISKKRSIPANPKPENFKEQPPQIRTTHSVQANNNLILELETTLENLRQAISQTETMVGKVTVAVEKNKVK